MFFSNVWSNHTDVIVHPSQLFTLSPQPLRLQSSDHLLRCFVHRTTASASPLLPFPAATGPASPRLGRLLRFDMYLGADHRNLFARAGLGGGGGGEGGAEGGGGSGGPQLLMSAHQTSRRTYQLHLGPGPGASTGRGGGLGGCGWVSPRTHLASPRRHLRSPRGGPGSRPGSPATGGAPASAAGCPNPSGCVAVLRSNMRCSHYELLPEASCPWARRLISLAGYLAPAGGPPPPLIRLEYRLRVRGIMLPRRMKVQVPVPHSLQHVVHNPLYDMHEPGGGAGAGVALAAGGGGGWQPAFIGGGGVGGAAAVMAPPLLAMAAPAGAAPGAAGDAAAGGGGGGGGGAAAGMGLGGDGVEGLMDNLEDILEAAIRTEPLLFANLVDAAAAVRPDDEDAPDGGAAGPAAAAAAGEAGPAAAGGVGGGGGGVAAGANVRRRSGGSGGGWGFGISLLRGFLNNRRHSVGTAAAAAASQGAGGGGSVQWWGPPGSPLGSSGGEAVAGSSAGGVGSGGAGAAAGAAGGWSCCSPAAPVPSVRLQNKAPHWNDALMCWCLNFRGRVKMASVKNFQLMACGDGAGRCVMQFGKVEEGVYILDFNPCVLTAAQAFAAALSTFETKYLL